MLDRSQRIGLGVLLGAVGLGFVLVVVQLVGGTSTTGSPGPSTSVPAATPALSSSPTPTPAPSPTPSPTPAPDPVDPLNGGDVDDGGVFAVKIDNVAAARPQIGLGAADIVVVEEVEAGLSRLVGVFHSEFPDQVGPVRSARNTDVELLPLFGQPGLVYSGANSKVQDNVQGSDHLVPIERSDRDGSRPAPHDVVVDLAALAEDNEVGGAADIGWEFGDRDEVWDAAEEYQQLESQIGSDEYTFELADGRYRPAVNGDPYTDADTGDPVLTDNVVRLTVENREDTDSTSSQSIVSETIGSGQAVFSREGRTVKGGWEREGLTEPMVFTDSAGDPILLEPGRTWLLLDG